MAAARFLLHLLLVAAARAVAATASTSLSTANVTGFSFSGFVKQDRGGNVTVLGDANINLGALQITPDSLNDAATYLTHRSGRVLYATPFKLWHRDDANATGGGGKRVASFSTVFTVNVFRPNGTEPAEGVAFVIAPSDDEPPAGSSGGYLGLTNAATDGSATNRVVAVELDTEKQAYDPDDNHVGLDVHSVVSVATASLTPLGIQISPPDPVKYDVWVDYDGAARRVAVRMAVSGKPRPRRAVLAAPLDLGEAVAQRSYFGFAASTGSKYQLNCVLAWNMTLEKLPSDDGDGGHQGGDGGKRRVLRRRRRLAVGAAAVAVVAAAAVVAYVCVAERRKKVHGDDDGNNNNSGSAITGTMIRSLAGGPREFEHREIRKATNNFDERMKLGQGGYGVVYRGVVVGDHTSPGGAGSALEVAVKKFSRASTQGQNDFLAELSIINRLRHKHLVRLVGWSHDNGELLLVYEYMPNGSLDQHLFSATSQVLGWELRYNIIRGVASALHYLHDEYDQRVVHRDLKASNILLDFGLARAIDAGKTSYMEPDAAAGGGVHGTVGYIAPECFHTEKATRESDVYAFGAVVLEVVCGRRPRCDGDVVVEGGFHFLVDWVWRLHRDGRALEAVDARLGGAFDAAQADRLILLGLACSHPTPAERPKTPAILQILLGSAPPPEVPPFKPAFVWPATATTDGGGVDTMSTTAGTTTSQLSLTSASTWSGSFVKGSLRHAFQQEAGTDDPDSLA